MAPPLAVIAVLGAVAVVMAVLLTDYLTVGWLCENTR